MSGGWTSRKGSAGAGAGVRGLGPPTQAISPVLSSQQAEGSEAPAPSAWKPAIHTRLTLPTSSFQVVDCRLSSGKLPPNLTGVQEAGETGKQHRIPLKLRMEAFPVLQPPADSHKHCVPGRRPCYPRPRESRENKALKVFHPGGESA
ncbi:uncharacterized protein LOC111551427 [Piliocolobus tephrosceles]|uniref:uncharacterized protein LOC111551427 n=1 Tax=Piliocolobus tephrosceles TaxID=591936 RepID=UPI000C2B200D|nr:uncharacterized protein LOC111551427 [Piliocolobus tephrosceles]